MRKENALPTNPNSAESAKLCRSCAYHCPQIDGFNCTHKKNRTGQIDLISGEYIYERPVLEMRRDVCGINGSLYLSRKNAQDIFESAYRAISKKAARLTAEDI